MAKPTATFSIVTPSFNQAAFLEETIKGVLDQAGDFSIQYIVADGDSTDNSVEIIKKYDQLIRDKKYPLKNSGVDLSWWSHPDGGQSDAINQGFRKAIGEYVAWINSDDVYMPGAFAEALKVFRAHPKIGLVYASMEEVDEKGRLVRLQVPEPFDVRRQIREGNFVPQPSTFMRREALFAVGLLNPKYHYAMDYDLWIRIGKRYGGIRADGVWSKFRFHPASKTVLLEKKFWKEVSQISRSHGGRFASPLFKNHYLARYPHLLANLNRLGRGYLLLKDRRYDEFRHKLHKNIAPGRNKQEPRP